MRGRGLVVLVMVLAGGGCQERGEADGAQRSPAKPVFNDLALTSAAPPTMARKQLGEDCATARTACDTQVCLRTGAGLTGATHYCSRPCRDETECPAGWSCPTTMPGPNGRVCVPPEEWTSRAVGVRP